MHVRMVLIVPLNVGKVMIRTFVDFICSNMGGQWDSKMVKCPACQFDFDVKYPRCSCKHIRANHCGDGRLKTKCLKCPCLRYEPF